MHLLQCPIIGLHYSQLGLLKAIMDGAQRGWELDCKSPLENAFQSYARCTDELFNTTRYLFWSEHGGKWSLGALTDALLGQHAQT